MQPRVSLKLQSLPFPMPQPGTQVILELGESETNVKYEAASVHLGILGLPAAGWKAAATTAQCVELRL